MKLSETKVGDIIFATFMSDKPLPPGWTQMYASEPPHIYGMAWTRARDREMPIVPEGTNTLSVLQELEW